MSMSKLFGSSLQFFFPPPTCPIKRLDSIEFVALCSLKLMGDLFYWNDWHKSSKGLSVGLAHRGYLGLS